MSTCIGVGKTSGGLPRGKQSHRICQDSLCQEQTHCQKPLPARRHIDRLALAAITHPGGRPTAHRTVQIHQVVNPALARCTMIPHTLQGRTRRDRSRCCQLYAACGDSGRRGSRGRRRETQGGQRWWPRTPDAVPRVVSAPP